MKILEILKAEFSGFGKYERILFPLALISVCIISFRIKDSKIALISAVCGMSYTILAGKGRVSCYYIGLTGTVCYSYLSFINGFFGNFLLYALYYFPMEIIGIFQWSRNLKKEKREIEKTMLPLHERIIYGIAAIALSLIFTAAAAYFGGKNPAIDGFSTGLSILGLLLTVKRCIEQWYIWFIVNSLTLSMWITAYFNGSNAASQIFMWAVYVVLSIYFLIIWKKEMKPPMKSY